MRPIKDIDMTVLEDGAGNITEVVETHPEVDADIEPDPEPEPEPEPEVTVEPNLLGIGGTGNSITAALTIGYYSMSNGQGLSKQVAPIEEAGHNAVKMTTLS